MAYLHLAAARPIAYVGDGKNRVPAVDVSDAARRLRLALEK